jgi:glycosyltransferase involved in cell wall biosynthesis
MARAVGDAIARDPGDVLFLPGNFHLPIAESVAALPPQNRPRVFAQISNPLRRPDRGGLAQAIFEARTRWLMRNVTCAIALTETARVEVDTVLRRPMAIALPSPALEDDWLAPTRPQDGPPLIVAIGRLVAQKDFGLAIRAFARIANPDARLVILGDGPLRPQLTGLIASLDLGGRVELFGYVDDVRPWLDRARCLLLSSRFEGYPAVVVEALAAGRPVVATPCCEAVRDLISTPQAGIVAVARTEQALAAAIDLQLATTAPNAAALAAQVARHRIGPVAAAYLEVFDMARIPALAEPLAAAISQIFPVLARDVEVC